MSALPGRRSIDSIAMLNDAITAEGHGGTAFDYLFLAMAHHKLGRTDEARMWLENGEADRRTRQSASSGSVFFR